mgnify:CR=1 FL=1
MYDWWNILIFGVIPVLTVVVIFIVKRKLLWTAPLISTALAFITYMVALAPITTAELFSNGEWRGFFLLALFMHLVITVVLTAIAYLAAYILKQKQE